MTVTRIRLWCPTRRVSADGGHQNPSLVPVKENFSGWRSPESVFGARQGEFQRLAVTRIRL
ncbi:hypothetical protein [Falsibacillus albus]|uniref:hypothetical protein n=1 Tax=Falsibacillus albus TaxID=2478915 RepID=UPI0011E5AD86|nr:hypothetical protein [Falsibacillus albus]